MAFQLNKFPEEQSELIGHEDIEHFFLNLIKKNQIDGSWIFSGPKGIGKATFAYRLSKFIVSYNIGSVDLKNTTNLKTDPNNKEVLSLIQKSNPRIKIIEKALKPKEQKERDELISKGEKLDPIIENNREKYEEIRIDDIRNIDSFLHMTLDGNKKRILIIDSADDMNSQASNALLKSLEEPPRNIIIILISHNIGKLLSTIKSRCRIINFHPLSYDNELIFLKENFYEKKENYLRSLALLSEGSIGNAIELNRLGGIEIYQQIIDSILRKSTLDAINSIEKYSKDKKVLNVFKKLFYHFVSNLLIYITDKNSYLEVTEGEHLVFDNLSKKTTPYDLIPMISEISNEFLDIDLDQKQICINNLLKFF
ncbi:MAG: AAA family ATPase [Alphaproteobacteria bacterium]|nr:AAA family ATPase [Alphaproteobacteria bacterium]